MTVCNLVEHALSPWIEDADNFVLVPVDGGVETLPARALGDGTFEICCVPFRVYDIDRGDRVAKSEDDHLLALVEKPGDCGFRFKTDRGEDTIDKIVKTIEAYGCTVEFDPSGAVIGVNAPYGTDQELVSGILATFEESEFLVYETIRISDVVRGRFRDPLSRLGGIVAPELCPVTQDEIEEVAASIKFPQDLVDCWLQIGCGFFSRDAQGKRVTKFQNRLAGPDEILELKEGGAYPENDPFDIGMPFFETADMRYLVLKEDGSVAHQSGMHVSDCLESFLKDVITAPEFWLHALRHRT